MSSTGVIAHSIFGDHVWFAGPLSVNGAAGGSTDYYKRTEDITDWSAALIPLPLSKTGMSYMCAAHRAVFMMFTAGNSVVSLNTGLTWEECNVALDEQAVQWNGRVYVCGSRMSSDGVTWAAIPNLSGTPLFTRARNSDGLIICGYSLDPDTYFEYTLNDGVSWTTVSLSGGYEAESLFSLTISNRSPRIHYSIGSPFGANIVNLFTDDLFVNQDYYAVSTQGVYEGRYGCSHLIQYEFSSVLMLSMDGGWSSRNVVDVTIDNAQHWLDYGNNQWAFMNRDVLGNPDTYTLTYSNDGGVTWVDGQVLYGEGLNVAYVGKTGNCALYPRPDYTLLTNTELYVGAKDALEYSASRNWDGNIPAVSLDEEYMLHNTNTDPDVALYKKNPTTGGYVVQVGALSPVPQGKGKYSISYDSQYFSVAKSAAAGDGLHIFRQVNDVFTDLVMPGANNTPQGPIDFHPTRQLLLTCEDLNSVCRVYLLSGTTVSGPYNSPSLSNPPVRTGFSPDGNTAVVNTTGNNLRVLDITDPATAVTILASQAGTASNSGNEGIYFTSDGTGIITVTQVAGVNPANIHYRSWDSGTSTLGAPVLLGTASYRVQNTSMSYDRRYLAVCKDLNVNYLEVFHLSADGTSILSSYTPELNDGGSATNVLWMGQ
jgi:hypothetical protein